MTWCFLDVASVEAVHTDLIENYGGLHGLRDPGLLASAVARAENSAYYDPDATAASVGACLAYGLIKNHAFLDGNKRIGLAALVDFLALNGWRLSVTIEEQIQTVWDLAANEITEEEFTAWVERSVAVSESAASQV